IGAAKRFSDLRAKLLALEYHEPFTSDSLSLVERLFADLVTTTESYEHLQAREEATAADLGASHAQLLPLKMENSRLLRENNALHIAVIRAKEEAAAAERAVVLERRRLEGELSELQFLDRQKDVRLREVSDSVEALRSSLRAALSAA
ncbi:unnamed protein product, partial [Phaeothamnion confervicola]